MKESCHNDCKKNKNIYQSTKYGHLIVRYKIKNKFIYKYDNSEIDFNLYKNYKNKEICNICKLEKKDMLCYIVRKKGDFSDLTYGFFYWDYLENMDNGKILSVNGKKSKEIKLNKTFLMETLNDIFSAKPKTEIFSAMADSNQVYYYMEKPNKALDDNNKARYTFFQKMGFIVVNRNDKIIINKILEKSIYNKDISKNIKNKKNEYFIYINKELFEKRPK